MLWLELVWIILGFAFLVGGGEVLVRGAASLAKLVGVSTLLIGVTVVAFGTSAPELAVNVLAALEGEGSISFGNIIGSNITNVGLILGITALVRPVDVHRSIITREIPFMLLATLLVAMMASDSFLGTDTINQYSRIDGAVMLSLFLVFFVVTTRVALTQRKGRKHKDPFIQEVVKEQEEENPLPWHLAIIFTFAGFVGVVYGGKLVVDSAVTIAEAMNISKTVIGLTIVAVGTSLPELATCVMAVRRGHTDLAMGNIVGSNIWNILLVLPITVLASPFRIPDDGLIDLGVMAVLSAYTLPLALRDKRITRWEGATLLCSYSAYIAWRTINAVMASGA